METSKRKWTKPELVILDSGRPEERILQTCKGYLQSGYDSQFNYCKFTGCQYCHDQVSS